MCFTLLMILIGNSITLVLLSLGSTENSSNHNKHTNSKRAVPKSPKVDSPATDVADLLFNFICILIEVALLWMTVKVWLPWMTQEVMKMLV